MGGNSSRPENEYSHSDHVPVSKQKDSKVKLPHNFESIMQDADVQLGRSPSAHLYEQLSEGVFLNNKRKASMFYSVTISIIIVLHIYILSCCMMMSPVQLTQIVPFYLRVSVHHSCICRNTGLTRPKTTASLYMQETSQLLGHSMAGSGNGYLRKTRGILLY